MGDIILDIYRSEEGFTVHSTWGKRNYNNILTFAIDTIRRYSRKEFDRILCDYAIFTEVELEYLKLRLL